MCLKIVFFMFLFNITSKLNCLQIKRILINIFPGGKTHNYVIKNLFDYTLENEDTFKYEYHIIIHEIDIETWKKEIELKSNNYFIYNYGNKTIFKELFGKSIEEMNKNPNYGFLNFNKGMKHNIREFIESGIIEKLKQKSNNEEDYFNIIGTDVPNYINKLLQSVFKIKLKMYIFPPAIPQIFFSNFELNPSYTPTVGSKFTDNMNFKERIQNYIIQTGTKIMFKIFQIEQSKLVNSYGYNLDSFIHFQDAIHFFQFPLSVVFPMSFPPNFILLNTITSKKAEKIKDESLNDFLNKYNINIYISQGTIMKSIENKDLLDIFNYYNEKKNIGFILGIREDLLSDKEISKFPKNVKIIRWINQNDLLGDSRIKLFITHGGFNSICESVYHGKPMIVLGVGLDQFNTASFVKKYNMGISFQSRKNINKNNIIESINEILLNDIYLNNTIKHSQFLKKLKNPRSEFKYWLDLVLEFGTEFLIIESYMKKFNWIIINGYDVSLLFIFIFFTLFYLVCKIFKYFYLCFFGTCEKKKKKEKMKFD